MASTSTNLHDELLEAGFEPKPAAALAKLHFPAAAPMPQPAPT